jgi:hypothetical protein
MSLVFGAILLLWGLMALLTRVLTDRPAESAEVTRGGAECSAAQASELELKQRAAAAAVVAALKQESQHGPHEFPIPPTPLVSAWQVVMRTNILNKRRRIR